jgi:L-ascorbate metabolism protein UlaG (beta-lactamase superfamily)
MTRRSLFMAMGTFFAAGTTLFAARFATQNRYYQGPVSDHFDGTNFFNPDGISPLGFLDLLRWQFNGQKQKWPETYPSPFPQAKPETRIDGDRLVVTYVGHASFLFQTGGKNILVDPVWSTRTSPLSFAGPKRVNEPGIAFENLPPIDIVIVTHNHYDHMDLATLEKLVAAYNPLIITPLGNDVIIKKAVPSARFTIMDWGQSHDASPLTIHCEPCHHWSARGSSDRRHALWAAFVIMGPGGNIYHIGDTGFHSGINYKAAREKYGRFKIATLPIGAYDPRWFMQGQHQNPDEAVEGFTLLGAERALGHHWGTVQLTDEAIEAPLVALHAALDKRNISHEKFLALRAGQVIAV